MHAVGDPDELYRSVRGLDFTVQQLVAAGTEPEAFEALLRYLLKKPNPMRSGPANWSPHATLGLPLPIIRDTLRAASTRIEAAIETHRSSALADLLGYLAEASAGDPTLRGFVHWIETLRKNEMYDAESAVPDSDENAVRLMTVHGSKGLEFPIVIL